LQQGLVTGAGPADAQDVFRGRVECFDQQIAIDDDDARVKAIEYVLSLRRLSVAWGLSVFGT
jgi:hypothetical protein